MKYNVIIPIGISGSGKSTWINTYKNLGYAVVCPDDIRRELTGNISDQTQNKRVFDVAYDILREYLNIGQPVIFDATNVNTKTRHKLTSFIYSVVPDAKIGYKLFDADVDVSYQRIRKDIENNVDRSDVPYDVLVNQYKNYQNTLTCIVNESLINIDNDSD